MQNTRINNSIATVEISPLFFYYNTKLMEKMMKTGAIIKYLPKNTTTEEIKKLREEFNAPDHKLILMISGEENILENLCDLIKSRKI